MLLQHKNAIIYGAGGSLGRAVAEALAQAGARVFVTGHRLASVQQTADSIRAAGGQAEVAEVDAFDEKAVTQHLATVKQQYGSVDISFNAAGVDVIQGVPLIELSLDDYVTPVTRSLQTRFLTAKAAGQVMKEQGSGVILFLTATPGGIGYPLTGGFAAACRAIECLSTNLAAELGIYGIRVLTIRSGGSPDSNVFKSAMESAPEVVADALRQMEADTMLKQLPLMADIAQTAVFLASPMASKITGVTIDVTSGTTAALNYRVSHS